MITPKRKTKKKQNGADDILGDVESSLFAPSKDPNSTEIEQQIRETLEIEKPPVISQQAHHSATQETNEIISNANATINTTILQEREPKELEVSS